MHPWKRRALPLALASALLPAAAFAAPFAYVPYE